MFNLLDFCNSTTVRDYWKEINYRPNCYEAAWIVWDSFNKSIKDKLEAFDYILNNFEDKSFYSYGEQVESFFTELRKFKKAIQILKTQITEETYSIFTVEEYYKNYEVLRYLSPEVFKKAILDMFLTTSLTIPEIEEKLKEMVKRKGGKIELKYKENGDSYVEVKVNEKIYIIAIAIALVITLITITTLLIR